MKFEDSNTGLGVGSRSRLRLFLTEKFAVSAPLCLGRWESGRVCRSPWQQWWEQPILSQQNLVRELTPIPILLRMMNPLFVVWRAQKEKQPINYGFMRIRLFVCPGSLLNAHWTSPDKGKAMFNHFRHNGPVIAYIRRVAD